MTRRGKTMWPTLAAVSIVLVAGYGYYMYHEVSYRLRLYENRVEKFEKRHTSMKSQLQVVYEHRAKLEATLTKERQDHIAAKQELLAKLKEYEANLTRARHEAFNRFNALDTQHKMLKVVECLKKRDSPVNCSGHSHCHENNRLKAQAEEILAEEQAEFRQGRSTAEQIFNIRVQHDELVADHSRMEQQYVRLGDDHRVVVANLKDDYQKLKDAKERESKALQDRVQELYNENELLRSDIAQHVSTLNEEKKSSETCLEDLKRVQTEKRELYDEVKTLGEQVTKLKASLRSRQVSRGRKYATTVGPSPTKIPRTDVVKQPSTPPQLKKESEGNAVPGAGFIKRHKQRKLDLQSSDLRIRELLIRNDALKQEDSIKDQYEKSPTEGGPVDEDIDEPESKLNKKETDFQHLVKRGPIVNNYDQPTQTGQHESKGLTGDENQDRAKDAEGRSNGDGLVEAKIKATVSPSESKTLKFKAADEQVRGNGDKEKLKTEEEAGKDFMKKQLHLQLQNKKRSQDVFSIERQDLNSNVEESLKEKNVQPTTKRVQQLNRGVRKTGGNASNLAEQEIKRTMNGDRRQLQPPETDNLHDQKDIAMATTDPGVNSKERDTQEGAPVSNQDNPPVSSQENPPVSNQEKPPVSSEESPSRNNPVASPLKNIKKVEASTQEVEHSDVARRSTEKPVPEPDGISVKVSPSSETLPRKTSVDKDKSLPKEPESVRKPEPTLPPPTSEKSYGAGENKDSKERALEPLSKGKALNLETTENEKLENSVAEKDSEVAESKEPGSITGKGNNHKPDIVVDSTQHKIPTKQIVPSIKDMHAEKPTEEFKVPETFEDDENSDQWGGDQPVEGKNREVFKGEREAKQARIADEKEVNADSKLAVQKGKEEKQDSDESDPLSQNEGNGADEEDRETDQFDSEANN